MTKKKVELNNLMLVGLTIRTNNRNELDATASKIAALANNYWSHQLAQGIKHRISPNTTYAVYTEYASDEHGDYTYFIGEAVDDVADQDLSQFKILTIPAGCYQKFTTPVGKMPDVVVAAWQEIWKMATNDFSGQRSYLADFEIYDHRASDSNNTIVDILIGINAPHGFG